MRCGCGDWHGLLSPTGGAIARLKRGDEVVVKAGFGSGEQEEDTVHIIADVAHMSALTAAGIKLGCRDGFGIELTGNHFDQFDLSPEAQAILDELAECCKEDEIAGGEW